MIEVKKQQSVNVKDALVFPLSKAVYKFRHNYLALHYRYSGITMLKIRRYCGFTFFGIFHYSVAFYPQV